MEHRQTPRSSSHPARISAMLVQGLLLSIHSMSWASLFNLSNMAFFFVATNSFSTMRRGRESVSLFECSSMRRGIEREEREALRTWPNC